ncbi:MAG: hypothetical protein FIB07_04070 [Candidatus Methanoperedens sp.]|nr:hypothetical protein [Candidatus Methanoperedens sp.]
MITGNEASLKARDYFESVMGVNAVIGFMVMSLKKDLLGSEWVVNCSFFPSVGARQRVGYIVKVDSEDGSIKETEAIVVKD